jgi:endonuclease III
MSNDNLKLSSSLEVRLREVETRLRATYGSPRHHNPEDPLDDLIFLMLSRMTQEVKYVRTYEALRGSLREWKAVRDAPRDDIEVLLTDAGLAATRARQIDGVLREITAREGRLSLDHLREMDDQEAGLYLTSLPGVGDKTAGCVLLYALGRDVCPVDTHVWRVLGRLGAASRTPWTSARARALERSIPRGIRGSLHVTVMAHGRAVCRARRPRCGECVISDLCPSALSEYQRID